MKVSERVQGLNNHICQLCFYVKHFLLTFQGLLLLKLFPAIIFYFLIFEVCYQFFISIVIVSLFVDDVFILLFLLLVDCPGLELVEGNIVLEIILVYLGSRKLDPFLATFAHNGDAFDVFILVGVWCNTTEVDVEDHLLVYTL